MLTDRPFRVVAARTYIPGTAEFFDEGRESTVPYSVRREAEAFPRLPVSKDLAPPEMAVIA
jgi:hypothetical protein